MTGKSSLCTDSFTKVTGGQRICPAWWRSDTVQPEKSPFALEALRVLLLVLAIAPAIVIGPFFSWLYSCRMDLRDGKDLAGPELARGIRDNILDLFTLTDRYSSAGFTVASVFTHALLAFFLWQWWKNRGRPMGFFLLVVIFICSFLCVGPGPVLLREIF